MMKVKALESKIYFKRNCYDFSIVFWKCSDSVVLQNANVIYKNYIEMSEVAHSGQLLLTATENKV
jgi:hypothetical protein